MTHDDLEQSKTPDGKYRRAKRNEEESKLSVQKRLTTELRANPLRSSHPLANAFDCVLLRERSAAHLCSSNDADSPNTRATPHINQKSA
jgi:hypothetical protein